MTQGSKYEEHYFVPFPPFTCFVDFVCSQAKTRNDPSFAFNCSSVPSQSKVEREHKHIQKSSVVVRKTDVNAAVNAHDSIPVKKN